MAVVFGTRPEAIKLAPVIHALAGSLHFEPRVLVTAQHRAMLDPMLEFFGIEAHHDLDLLEVGQSLAQVTTRALEGISNLLDEERPDAVLVQGDTTSAFAAALAGHYRRLPVVHLEAGLRTGNRYAPFPEETNRRLVSQIASVHLAPTHAAAANLLGEGVPPVSVFVTGNTVVDALLYALERRTAFRDPALADLDGDPRRVLLVTAHRRESWGPALREIGAAIADVAKGREADVLVVFPIHRNAVVREAVLPEVDGLVNVRVVEPLQYGEFVRLMSRSYAILTDSGGIQEEAPTLGKPVLVLREVTERPEAVSAGSASVVGLRRADIVAAVERLLDDEAAYAAMQPLRNPFGDGRASERCVAALTCFFGLGPRPQDFGERAPL